MEANCESIAQFSQRDACQYPNYEAFLSDARDILRPLLDNPPPDPFQGPIKERVDAIKILGTLASGAFSRRHALAPLYELLTSPASHILDKWFESDMLKTTLACDAVIGALISPKHAGSGYILLHHVLGEAAGRQGVWAYVEGG